VVTLTTAHDPLDLLPTAALYLNVHRPLVCSTQNLHSLTLQTKISQPSQSSNHPKNHILMKKEKRKEKNLLENQ
jgi:hypothetical protein